MKLILYVLLFLALSCPLAFFSINLFILNRFIQVFQYEYLLTINIIRYQELVSDTWNLISKITRIRIDRLDYVTHVLELLTPIKTIIIIIIIKVHRSIGLFDTCIGIAGSN